MATNTANTIAHLENCRAALRDDCRFFSARLIELDIEFLRAGNKEERTAVVERRIRFLSDTPLVAPTGGAA